MRTFAQFKHHKDRNFSDKMCSITRFFSLKRKRKISHMPSLNPP